MQTNYPSPSRARMITGNTLISIGGLALLFGGLTKFAHVPKVVAQMTLMGFGGDKLLLIATLEVLAGSLLLFRPVRPFGLLYVSSYLGGAICAHVQSNQFSAVAPPMIVMGICWMGVLLRHPQAWWNLREAQGASQRTQEKSDGWAASQA